MRKSSRLHAEELEEYQAKLSTEILSMKRSMLIGRKVVRQLLERIEQETGYTDERAEFILRECLDSAGLRTVDVNVRQPAPVQG